MLKTFSGSSPIFALSIYTTFSQTQIGATVPLNQIGPSEEKIKKVLPSISLPFFWYIFII
jgi:hypothetical protein